MARDEPVHTLAHRKNCRGRHNATDQWPITRAHPKDATNRERTAADSGVIHPLHGRLALLSTDGELVQVHGLIGEEMRASPYVLSRKIHTPCAKAASTIEKNHRHRCLGVGHDESLRTSACNCSH